MCHHPKPAGLDRPDRSSAGPAGDQQTHLADELPRSKNRQLPFIGGAKSQQHRQLALEEDKETFPRFAFTEEHSTGFQIDNLQGSRQIIKFIARQITQQRNFFKEDGLRHRDTVKKRSILRKRGDEFIEHPRAYAGSNQYDNNDNQENSKGHPDIAEHQAPDCA